MKIAIAGAGAIGCRFGAMLHESGAEVILIDNWQDHVEKIRKDGLQVDSDNGIKVIDIPIYYPTEIKEQVDVVLMFTKSMMLETMLNDIKQIIGKETKVISLLNGIGHEEILKKHVAPNNIIVGVTIFTAQLIGPGEVKLRGTGTTEMQNFKQSESGERATKEIVEIFDHAGLMTTYSEDVKFSIWRKACVNSAMNALCALLDCNLAQFLATTEAEKIIREIVKEFVAVANKRGISLDFTDMVNYIVESSRKVGEHYPSMHQDLVQNNRYTEVDFLNGAISKFGVEYNIDTKYNDFITELIHVKEQLLAVK